MKKLLVIALVAAFVIGRLFITPRLTHIPSPELSYEAFADFLEIAILERRAIVFSMIIHVTQTKMGMRIYEP